ncbi:hypothetical protein O3G_MSEX004638 [Manduca sexta]|uniref:Uncharacterized protein n=1 Tax=Manduca sexta TaxID=7130 RepID=A0A922CI15_MANSE|nr:hypothetical protein O3G_MSEX004638 [Manduca sexta]
MINVDNWTSCEEFLNNTSFNASSLLDIDWQIFFFWNWMKEESYHMRFSVPTPSLLARFRQELDADIKPPVNWSEADLFMESSIDFSALLVKAGHSGLYRLISSMAFEYKDIPSPIFAFKVVEPGYLGILNCKFRLCYALAPVDKMPHYDHLEEAAKTLNFWGEYNRTFVYIKPNPLPPPKDDFQDDDDDQQVEIMGKMQFL